MNDIETRLKRLQPNAGALDRDRLLYSAAFAAGRSAGRRPWRITSAFLLAAIIGVCLWWVYTPKLMPLPANAAKQDDTAVQTNIGDPEPYRPEPTSYIALMRHLGDDPPVKSYPELSLPPAPLTPHSRID